MSPPLLFPMISVSTHPRPSQKYLVLEFILYLESAVLKPLKCCVIMCLIPPPCIQQTWIPGKTRFDPLFTIRMGSYQLNLKLSFAPSFSYPMPMPPRPRPRLIPRLGPRPRPRPRARLRPRAFAIC